MKNLIAVTMKEQQKGAPEGHTVFTYEAGKTYELPEDLAEVFLADKMAIRAKKGAEITSDERTAKLALLRTNATEQIALAEATKLADKARIMIALKELYGELFDAAAAGEMVEELLGARERADYVAGLSSENLLKALAEAGMKEEDVALEGDEDLRVMLLAKLTAAA